MLLESVTQNSSSDSPLVYFQDNIPGTFPWCWGMNSLLVTTWLFQQRPSARVQHQLSHSQHAGFHFMAGL